MTDRDLISNASGEIERLLEIMRRLRDPISGCPWDIEQDFSTIAPHTIEEAYEVADAIERQDWPELEAELGDLLFQTVFHAQMAKEAGYFDFNCVVRNICEKMIARHPHIFGNENRNKSADQQIEDWEKIKQTERANKAQMRVLDGVTLGLPALIRALKLQKRAARVGFDWPDVGPVIAKITEECQELVEAREKFTQDKITEEYGDLLFSIVNLGRHLQIDPEQALQDANKKFIRRFNALEDKLHALGKSPAGSSLTEMDRIWDLVKADESK